MSRVKELAKHLKAFELYYSQGFERSYDKVAKELRVTKKTIENWGKEFKWQERVAERDKSDAERLREEVFKFKLKSLKVLSKAIDLYEKGIDDGTVKVVSTKDIETVIKTGLGVGGTQVETVNSQPDGVNDNQTVTGFTFDINGMPTAERKEKSKDGDIYEN